MGPEKTPRSQSSTAPHCDQQASLTALTHTERAAVGKKRTNITPLQLCLHIHRQILLGNDKEQLEEMDFRDTKRSSLPRLEWMR